MIGTIEQPSAGATAAGGTPLGEHRGKVFLDRYALKGQGGRPLEATPEEMWRRVARAIAAVEATEELRRGWEERFYDALAGFKFVPGGRILAGAGTGHAVTYFNCFVIASPEDSRGGILDSLKVWTEIQARGGGVGINLSTLRPRGSYIKSVNGTSSGPVSWAELYSVVTGDVIQQGGSRRGAAMVMLDDDHPDIREFIAAKRIDPRTNSPLALEHANVSVAVSDAFMEAVRADAEWQTQFPTRAGVRALVEEARRRGDATLNEGAVAVTPGPTYRARELWDLICERAWATAEPGVVFIDRANRESNSWYYLTARATNPCGEIALAPNHVCNLGALNLAAYVVERGGAERPFVDHEALAHDARVAVRFLDNTIDANHYFLEENRAAQLGTRRIGLGTMGLADALIALGVRYGSDESLRVVEEVYRTIRDAAYDASADLGAEKGVAPEFDAGRYLEGPFIRRLPEPLREKIARRGMRNISLLCVAPTGTTSLLAGVSSGVEPVFAFAFVRRDRTGEHVIHHPLLQAWQDAHPGEDPPACFVATPDLTPEDHVRVQATVQRYVDQQISKTLNGPTSHTVDDVKRLYRLAYDLGCKGITYYRDGSRDAVLTHVEGAQAGGSEQAPAAPPPPATIRPRPAVLHGYTRNIKAPEGTVNITVNGDEGGPLEVFVNVGRAGSDVAALAEALGRLISLALRVPSPMGQHDRLRELVSQLRGIGGSRSVGFGPEQVRSLPDAVGKALGEHLDGLPTLQPPAAQLRLPLPGSAPTAGPDRHGGGATIHLPGTTGALCPTCGNSTVVRESSCERCIAPGCTFTRC